MLQHLAETIGRPKRVVIVGATSFIGKALMKRLEMMDIDVVPLSRNDVDLTDADASTVLSDRWGAEDSVVTVSAKAPCRNMDDFETNARIIRALVGAFQLKPVAHILNISSDAVYPDEPVPLHEGVLSAPTSLHGAMHLTREIALSGLNIPIAHLRPTLVYGPFDPHNGYGPNLFRRQANSGQHIALYGKGEEVRDHVFVDDVAELAQLLLTHRSVGKLNAATGEAASFMSIAESVIALSGKEVRIKERPRSGPMPHNGYRPFDAAETVQAFPEFTYTPLDVGLQRAQALEFPNG